MYVIAVVIINSATSKAESDEYTLAALLYTKNTYGKKAIIRRYCLAKPKTTDKS